MAADKWYRLTPDQIENLDKERTIVVLPLATLGSFDRETRLWEDLKAVRSAMMRIRSLGALTTAAAVRCLGMGPMRCCRSGPVLNLGPTNRGF